MKKILIFTLVSLVFAGVLSSCSYKRQKSAITDYDYSEMDLVQLQTLKGQLYDGQPVAIVKTSAGTISVALFPEYAPNTAANFIARAEEGFYDDSPFLGILLDEDENPVYVKAGVNTERQLRYDDGGALIEINNEYSVNMWPFKGALGSAGEKQGVCDSRFFIVNEQPLGDEELDKMREWVNGDSERLMPEELVQAFGETGGSVTISGLYTIFGQTYKGFDIIEKICAMNAEELNELRIVSVKIEKYTP
jgi:peptidyl-prolyl cis-trans isomerase B (cyclophilin B)